MHDFSDLKPGDRVFISTRYGRAYTEGIVERLTKTQIVVKVSHHSERRFRMDGVQVGAGETDRLIRYGDPRARRYFLVERASLLAYRVSEAAEKFRRDAEFGTIEPLLQAVEALKEAESRLRDDQKTSDSAKNS